MLEDLWMVFVMILLSVLLAALAVMASATAWRMVMGGCP